MNAYPETGREPAPLNQTAAQAARSQPAERSQRPFLSRFNPRIRILTGIAILWILVWLLQLTALEKSAEAFAWLALPATLVLIAAGAVVALVYGRFGRLFDAIMLVVPHVIAALVMIFFVAVAIQVEAPFWLSAIVVVGSSLTWLFLTAISRIWWVEVKAGHVYFYQRYNAEDNDSGFVVRPDPTIDPRLIIKLEQIGMPRETLRIYLNWGAPRFLRDELAATLLTLHYNRLADLVRQYPQCFSPLTFKVDTYDVIYTQQNLTAAFKTYHSKVEQLIDSLKRAMASNSANKAQIKAQLREAEQAQVARTLLYQQYCDASAHLHELFVQSEDPSRQPQPFFRISPLDHWRLFWRKTETVGVEVVINDLMTLDNLPFQVHVTCTCSFEPEKVTHPGLRLAFRGLHRPEDVRNFVVDSVSRFIKQQAHVYFQALPRKEALEAGFQRFRTELPAAYQSAAPSTSTR